jgi:hypothetical protein
MRLATGSSSERNSTVPSVSLFWKHGNNFFFSNTPDFTLSHRCLNRDPGRCCCVSSTAICNHTVAVSVQECVCSILLPL